MNVDRLRAQTRSEHEAVEALLPLTAADLTREQYAEALRRMYSVVHGWENWASQHAPEQLRDLLIGRRRSHLLQADLSFLGCEPVFQASESIQQQLEEHFAPRKADRHASLAEFLGTMYVMEGSTLGGQYIARHVEEKLAFRDGQGDSYFRGYGDQTGSMWRSFKENLIALPEKDSDDVIAAARFMFCLFGKAVSAADFLMPAPALR